MPKYTESEIFNNYQKIAEEKGLLKTARNETKEQVKEIEKLYHFENKDLKGKKNFSELAHPESVVVSPAHDKINGLLENITERQNIMLNLVNKPVSGYLTARKYAHENLLTSLVAIANDLDNKDLTELRVLADSCIEQLQPLKKEAIGLLGVGLIGGAVATAGGLLWLQQHADFNSLGFERDAKRLLEELEEVKTSGTGLLSFRSEYKDEFKNQITKVEDHITGLLTAYQNLEAVLNDIESYQTKDELEQILHTAQNVSSKNAYADAYSRFKLYAYNIIPELETLKKNFQDEDYKARQVKDEGLGSKINDFFGGVLSGGKGLVRDQFDDVLKAIDPMIKSMKKVLDKVREADSHGKVAEKKLEAAKGVDLEYSAPKETAPSTEAKSTSDEDQKFSLMKEIENLKQKFPDLEKYLNLKK